MPDEDADSWFSEAILEAQSHGRKGWRASLNNYRELVRLDNGLVWLLNLVTAAIGYGIITEVGGAAGWIIGGLLFASGAVGILDSVIGRVISR